MVVGLSVELTYAFLVIVAFVLGVYFARQLLPNVLPLIERAPGGSGNSPGPLRIVATLAMATVLALPLLDLLGVARVVIELLSRTTWNETLVSPWGTAPMAVFELLSALTVLGAYVFTVWVLARSGLTNSLLTWMRHGSAIARTLLVPFAIASFVAYLAKTVLLQVVWLPVNLLGNPSSRGLLGVAGSWILGLLLLALLVLQADAAQSGTQDQHHGSA